MLAAIKGAQRQILFETYTGTLREPMGSRSDPVTDRRAGRAQRDR